MQALGLYLMLQALQASLSLVLDAPGFQSRSLKCIWRMSAVTLQAVTLAPRPLFMTGL